MSKGFSEAHVEEAGLGFFKDLGYEVLFGGVIAPDGDKSERQSYDDVILRARLEDAVGRLNPALPESAREDVLRKIFQSETPSLVEENRRLHKLMTEGAPVEFYGDDGVLKSDIAHLVDFEEPENNDWLAVNQFTVIEDGHNRRPDIVVFMALRVF